MPIGEIIERSRIQFVNRGLGATYDVHLRLTAKRVVDFILVLIELIC